MKYLISTLGCKVNQYETQAMETILLSRGHVPAAPGEAADQLAGFPAALRCNSAGIDDHGVRCLSRCSRLMPPERRMVSMACVSY